MFRLLYLGNGWADCVEIWHALGDPLVTAYAVVTGGVSLHVRTCRDTHTPRFCISETARVGSGSGLSEPFSEVAVKMSMEYWLPFGLVLLFQILCIKTSPFMISYFAL